MVEPQLSSGNQINSGAAWPVLAGVTAWHTVSPSLAVCRGDTENSCSSSRHLTVPCQLTVSSHSPSGRHSRPSPVRWSGECHVTVR